MEPAGLNGRRDPRCLPDHERARHRAGDRVRKRRLGHDRVVVDDRNEVAAREPDAHVHVPTEARAFVDDHDLLAVGERRKATFERCV